MKSKRRHTPAPTWAEAFRELRAAMGDSQAEAATRLGLAVQTISRWERGDTRLPHRAQRRAILDVFYRAPEMLEHPGVRQAFHQLQKVAGYAD